MQNNFTQTLKNAGYSNTTPRRDLFNLLRKNHRLTVRQLIHALPHHDRATIYRNILLLEKIGIIERIYTGWKYTIELSHQFLPEEHHHHLSCLQCGIVTPVHENEQIEALILDMAKNANFQLQTHQLELRGLCTMCVDSKS